MNGEKKKSLVLMWEKIIWRNNLNYICVFVVNSGKSLRKCHRFKRDIEVNIEWIEKVTDTHFFIIIFRMCIEIKLLNSHLYIHWWIWWVIDLFSVIFHSTPYMSRVCFTLAASATAVAWSIYLLLLHHSFICAFFLNSLYSRK